MAKFSAKPNDLSNIDFTPPKTEWTETPVEIREHMFCHAAKPKDLEAVEFPNAHEWRPQDEDWKLPANWETIILQGCRTCSKNTVLSRSLWTYASGAAHVQTSATST